MPVVQMSFVPPADSPFRSRSYATFVTDLELQQARAEMEECYRRRARRAGLEDTLPVGRPMTDEEIEDLQWQLGDFGPANGYGSRGRKRTQQDVIDMTIEEMEAEIRETNEAIRQRRRRAPWAHAEATVDAYGGRVPDDRPGRGFHRIRLYQQE